MTDIYYGEIDAKHIKKKKKSHPKRNNHKHKYVPALFIQEEREIGYGTICKRCGRVGEYRFNWRVIAGGGIRESAAEKFKRENPDYVSCLLDDDWNVFKDKFVAIGVNE